MKKYSDLLNKLSIAKFLGLELLTKKYEKDLINYQRALLGMEKV